MSAHATTSCALVVRSVGDDSAETSSAPRMTTRGRASVAPTLARSARAAFARAFPSLRARVDVPPALRALRHFVARAPRRQPEANAGEETAAKVVRGAHGGEEEEHPCAQRQPVQQHEHRRATRAHTYQYLSKI